MKYFRMLYAAKWLVPRAAQIRLRQILARRKRRQVADVWPILPGSGNPPPGWQGWPDGKRFACVLTHDVETQRGLDRCRAVMDLEESLGFRSCFYLVPKRYTTPDSLVREMLQRGFEVGVHGLYHDMTLFRSEEDFRQQAVEINRYLQAWSAVGFRAPYMVKNLEWIRDHLDIQYDTSTFDTDPFEPAPEDVGTIFPFRVEGAPGGRPGYVELPCTLPQDLNLLVMLGEQTTAVWQAKLDWIAARGGLMLLNTHPDFMQAGGTRAVDEYPIRLYREFLAHVRDRQVGQYWQALPREVAAWFRGRTLRAGPPRRACMVAYSFYENDGRINRYALSLVRAGYTVDAISLGRPGQPAREEIDGVQVERIQTRRRDERGQFDYLIRMLRFMGAAAALLNARPAAYHLVHVHSVPDFLVFVAWRARQRGAKIILDLHDLVPEFYASKFGVSRRSLVFRLLRRVERLACRFADHVITANDLWHDVIVGRAVPGKKCSSFVNNVNGTIFHPRARTRQDERFVLVYPGGLQKHQGVEVVIRAMPAVLQEFPRAEFHVYGEGNQWDALAALIQELRLEHAVFLHHSVPLREVPEIMANADLGVVPKLAEGFGNEAYSTKILEFMSQGLPVVVSRTRIDQHYFGDGQVCFFESGNAVDLAATICELARDPERRRRLAERGVAHARQNTWACREQEYLGLVEKLCGENDGRVAPAQERTRLRASP